MREVLLNAFFTACIAGTAVSPIFTFWFGSRDWNDQRRLNRNSAFFNYANRVSAIMAKRARHTWNKV